MSTSTPYLLSAKLLTLVWLRIFELRTIIFSWTSIQGQPRPISTLNLLHPRYGSTSLVFTTLCPLTKLFRYIPSHLKMWMIYIYFLHTKEIGSNIGKMYLEWGNVGSPYRDLSYHKDTVISVNKIGENFEVFTNNEVKRACNARKAVGCLVNTTKKDFKGMVRENLIPNSPVTPKEITKVCLIFGPYLEGIFGKIVRQEPYIIWNYHMDKHQKYLRLQK